MFAIIAEELCILMPVIMLCWSSYSSTDRFLGLFHFSVPFLFRLDVYIYDYLVKRKLDASAKAFQAEGKVSTDPVGKTPMTL